MTVQAEEFDRPIIRSLLDDDLYKLTMAQAVMRSYDRVIAGYAFINRGKTQFPKGFAEALRQQVASLAELKLQPEEEVFLRERCGHYLRPSFIDWFAGYRYNPEEVTITQKGGELIVTVEGLWYRTIFWEVKLLALISELYYLMTGQQPVGGYELRAYEKAEKLHEHDATFIEFGTRRRFSQEVQENVLIQLISGGKSSMMGTSNIDLACRYRLTPVGTHAHEWHMAHAGMFGYRSATKEALRVWAEEFQGHLGFALTDTFTTEAFLPEFNAYFAKLFDGVRQDSGDPLLFVDRMVSHYRSLRMDPFTKQIVFSDALDVEKAIHIREYSEGRIKQAIFGIGTNFTNDVGVTPLNIVMKLSYIISPQQPDRRIYVVKFGDGAGKVTGLDQAVSAARFELGLTS